MDAGTAREIIDYLRSLPPVVRQVMNTTCPTTTSSRPGTGCATNAVTANQSPSFMGTVLLQVLLGIQSNGRTVAVRPLSTARRRPCALRPGRLAPRRRRQVARVAYLPIGAGMRTKSVRRRRRRRGTGTGAAQRHSTLYVLIPWTSITNGGEQSRTRCRIVEFESVRGRGAGAAIRGIPPASGATGGCSSAPCAELVVATTFGDGWEGVAQGSGGVRNAGERDSPATEEAVGACVSPEATGW